MLTSMGCLWQGWATVFCGALVTHGDSDFVTDIGISRQSMTYPRVLVPETEVNGKTELAITCSDGNDCQTKCDYFSRIARDGGLPAPQGCALCAPPCPDNIGTTFISFVHAFVADVGTALRLAATCLGPGGVQACVCQIFMLLKPAWIKNLDAPTETCEGGDVFQLIAKRIELFIVEAVEGYINNYVFGWMRAAVGWLGVEINDICITRNDLRKYCPNDPKKLEALLGCEVGASNEPHKRCFYE